MRLRLPVALVAASAISAACGAEDPAPRSASTTSTPSGAATAPAASESSVDPSSGTVPLVLAVHPSHPGGDVSLAAARRLIDGAVTAWSELGGAGRGLPGKPILVGGPASSVPPAMRAASDSDALAALDDRVWTVAVVPATALGPTARALTVDGVDPLRDPGRYPLRVPGPAADQRVVTLSIVGDLMLARRVGTAITAGGDPAAPLRPLADRLAAADLTVGTFESTLSRLGPPTQGGDSFGADPAVLAGVRLAGFDLLSLANNHVGDYGDRSLVQTVRRLRSAGFATVGAGADDAAAREPVVLEANGVRIGVLAFNAIGETPRAGPGRPGAVTLAMQPRLGPLDDADLTAMTRAVAELGQRTDAVLVLPHWGEQYTPVAVADQRRVARALVEAGADLVIGSHPHVVQGAAVHTGDRGPGFVAYSLGNFVFDMDFSVPTQQGVILEVTLWGGEVKATRFVPYRIGADFAPRVLADRSPQGRAILGRVWANGGEEFSPPR